MHRILLNLGPFTIYSYGALLALAFIVGTYLAERRARKQGFPKDTIVDLSLWMLISSIAGARFLFVGINWEYYSRNIGEIFKIWEGGLVYYGGLVLGFWVTVYYLKNKKLPLWKIADILAPSLALAEAIGRIGCFLNGCCYGRIVDRGGLCFPAVGAPPVFTQHLRDGFLPPGALHSLPVIPTQLYSAGASLVIFFILLRAARYRTFDGFLFWLFIILYSLARFIIEGFRYYESNFLLFGGFTVSQWISVFLAVVAVFFLFRGFQKRKAGIKS
jgi:phosphatidylglycerol:prolipoprotein diacylglycerol transferase